MKREKEQNTKGNEYGEGGRGSCIFAFDCKPSFTLSTKFENDISKSSRHKFNQKRESQVIQETDNQASKQFLISTKQRNTNPIYNGIPNQLKNTNGQKHKTLHIKPKPKPQ